MDLCGGQAGDFFAQAAGNPGEFLSPGVTIHCNESLALRVGDTIYTNLYRPMFLLLRDDAGQNDLIHPSCRKEMFDFFYHDGEGHPNCLDNLNGALGTNHPILQPVNLFMNTRILPDGRIRVEAPASRAGDCIVLRALMDARVGLAACSVSESACNAGRCTPLAMILEDA